MKKSFTILVILLFAGASLFAQKPHHGKNHPKKAQKEYKHHHDYRQNRTVVVVPAIPRPQSVNIQLPSAPRPPSVNIQLPSAPRPPSVNIQLPAPPPPPRPPR
jgi:hypothetical protein